jgi:hypothetical protein
MRAMLEILNSQTGGSFACFGFDSGVHNLPRHQFGEVRDPREWPWELLRHNMEPNWFAVGALPQWR